MFYSVSRRCTASSGSRQAYWSLLRRVDTSKGSSRVGRFGRRASSDTRSCPLPSTSDRKTAMSICSQPHSLTCRLLPMAPKGRVRCNVTTPTRHHFKRQISLMSITNCRKSSTIQSVPRRGRRAPQSENPSSFSGYTAASSDGLGRSLPHCAACGDTPASAIRARIDPARPLFKSPLDYANRPSGREPSHRYPWRCFKAVCPHRCWRQPGPPIPCTESRARWA